jgi:ParB family transcriptional regulator, chromosome partitioning protein
LKNPQLIEPLNPEPPNPEAMNPEPRTFKPRLVDLARIDVDDDSFRITTGKNIDDLMGSIKCLGLLNLPVLLEKKTGYSIISGFRRVEACRRLNWIELSARVLPSDTDIFKCVTYAVADNAFQRPLDIIEKSKCFNMLSVFYKDVDSMAEALPKLGISEHPAMIDKVKMVYHMPEPLQNSILSNTIALATALKLAELSIADAQGLIGLFNALSLSLNKQREILTMVKEIAIREDKSITQVLETPRLKNILKNTDLDKNQKARNIRRYLKQRRFPAITTAEQSFRQHLKKLNLGKAIELIPPVNFEGSTYTLKLTFNHLNELKNLKNTLEIFTENPHLKKIVGD